MKLSIAHCIPFLPVLGVLLSSCGQDAGPTTAPGEGSASAYRGSKSPAKNRAIGERFVGIWDCTHMAAGLAEIDALFAADFVDNNPIIGPTREDYKGELRLFCSAFPDLVATAQQIITDGDLVVVRWTARATYAGGLSFLGINDAVAVGRTVTLKGIDILRIERGLIAERWGEFDAFGMIAQLNAT